MRMRNGSFKVNYAFMAIFFILFLMPYFASAGINAGQPAGIYTLNPWPAPWELNSSLLSARDQFAGGVIDGKIFVFGGNGDPDIEIKSTEMYDPLTASWSYRESDENNGGFGVEELSGAVLNGKLYVFGAIGPGHDGVYSFVEEYDPVSGTWNSKAPMDPPRTAGTAVVYNGEIYIFGGFTEGDPRPFTDIVQAFNPSTNQWRSVTNIPKLVGMSAVAVVGDKAFLFGGYNFNEEEMSQEVLIYNIQTDTWDITGHTPLPNPRCYSYAHGAPIIDGKIYLIGGSEGEMGNIVYSDRVDIYDIETDTWFIGPALPYPIDRHLTIAMDNSIYVVGGKIGPDQFRTAAVWELQPAGSTCNFDIAPADGDVDGSDLFSYQAGTNVSALALEFGSVNCQ